MPDTIRRTCGAYEYHVHKLRSDPAYASARRAIEAHTREFVLSNRMMARAGVTTIPVVVHVVYQTDDQNISDQQIASQIDVLNRDYRMTNPDSGGVPGPFASVEADARRLGEP